MSMRIRRLNSAVFPVDHHFRPLIPADYSASIDCLTFRLKVTTCARASAAFDIPASVSRGNDVMSLSCHGLIPSNH